MNLPVTAALLLTPVYAAAGAETLCWQVPVRTQESEVPGLCGPCISDAPTARASAGLPWEQQGSFFFSFFSFFFLNLMH